MVKTAHCCEVGKQISQRCLIGCQVVGLLIVNYYLPLFLLLKIGKGKESEEKKNENENEREGRWCFPSQFLLPQIDFKATQLIL